MKNIILLSLLLLSGVLSLSAKSLKGAKLDFVCQDTVFKQPFIDIDEIHTKPVRYRYIHGGFADGTRFSFYFPEKAKYKGHFFQYITPFPDSETSAQAGVGSNNFINFSVSHGAYFIETNEGGRLTFTPGEKRREASIGAYRANAACAQLSRYIAHLIYDCPRPYGYAFGGSGGAYRTTGAAESTTGVWDGFVPFILGSPQAIPNVFAVRMYALRVLKDVLPKIVDALEPGGSGNPYEGLTVEQAQVLQEATRMGFPIKAWYGYKYMDVHGFLVLYNGVVSADPTYFNHDFWNVPGYLGYDAPESLRKARVQKATVVTKILGEDACERLGLVKALSAKDRGTADQAWRSMGSDIKDKPVGYELADNIPEFGMGGDLVILTGKAKGQKLQITKVDGNHIAVASFSDLNILKKLHVGDSVRCDNSDFLAIQTYHRHQVPTPDYYVWDQFRDYQGHPIYPQRPMLLGPIFTRSAAGCLPTGKIHGKMILCCSVWDREAFAWQGDWYRKKVQDHLADSLGMEMAIASAPGWSATGGPWVRLDEAMKKLVWRQVDVRGGRQVHLSLPTGFNNTGNFLDTPVDKDETTYITDTMAERFYRDIAVLAVRLPEQDRTLASLHPVLTSSSGHFTVAQLTNDAVSDTVALHADAQQGYAWIQYSFPKPQTFCALSIADGNIREKWDIIDPYITKHLEVSDDGIHFRKVCDIPHGGAARQTIDFPSTTARCFRVVFDNPRIPNTLESRLGIIGKAPQNTYISELNFYTTPRVNHAEEKAGYAVPWDLKKYPTVLDDSLGRDKLKTEAVSSKDVIDLSSAVDAHGNLTWKAPYGNWRIIRFGYSLTGKKNHPASPEATGLEVDKMDTAAFRHYILQYMDMYQKASDGQLGRAIQFMLTDSYEAGPENWTPRMEEEFQRRRGYALRPWLPVLTGMIVGSADKSERFLADWRQTLGELVTENYRQLAEILHAKGMKLYSESHENGRQYEPDGMSVKQYADIPMSAMWVATPLGGSTPAMAESDIRESASVAHLYDKPTVAAESFTAIGFGNKAYWFSPQTLKSTADKELASGLNRFVIHESAHQPLDDKIPGLGLGIFGQWFNRHDTWAEQAKCWTDYLSRSSYLLSQGRFVADILYYYGDDNNITGLFGKEHPQIPIGYNFDYLNTDALLSRISARPDNADGTVSLVTPGDMQYRVLVLDKNVRDISMSALRKINDLVHQGAVICGQVPERSSGLKDNPVEFERLVNDIWYNNRPNVFTGVSVGEVLKTLSIPQDVKITDPADPSFNSGTIDVVHRRTEADNIYWLSNTSEKDRELNLLFRSTAGVSQCWRPETGEREGVAYKSGETSTEVRLHMEPHEAFFIVLSKDNEPLSVRKPITEWVEQTPVATPWTVSFQPHRGAPAQAVFPQLISYTKSANDSIRYFSGTAAYKNTFRLSGKDIRKRVILSLGNVKNLAEVWVNGRSMGTLWHAPFSMDISSAVRKGNNEVEIHVTNAWVNRIIGDLQPSCKNPITCISTPFYQATSPLVESGLIGPVNILFQ